MIMKLKAFFKDEVVFCISLVCAVATMFAVPPDFEYASYIDFRVLCLLFSLMAVVAAFKKAGVFSWLTYKLLSRIKNGRILGLTLVLLVFFISMLVTNDVALLIFVPFTIGILTELGCGKSTVITLVLQTVAANLGSMATPIGNPQNLFLYSTYDLSADDFFSVTLPLTLVSLLGLSVASLFILPESLNRQEIKKEGIVGGKKLAIYILLFLLCLLTVFKLIPYAITTAVIVVAVLFIDKKLLKDVDFMLLLTFVCFFIISENLGRIDVIKSYLCNLLDKNTFLTCVGASQIISNVPAAVLLSGFTENWRAILAGVNIGGLGTPVASLASLITLKFYMRSDKADTVKFLLVFTLANIIGLAMLMCYYFIF